MSQVPLRASRATALLLAENDVDLILVDRNEQGLAMSLAVRGGKTAVDGVAFHTDHGSTDTANSSTKLCRDNGIRQSMGRIGSTAR